MSETAELRQERDRLRDERDRLRDERDRLQEALRNIQAWATKHVPIRGFSDIEAWARAALVDKDQAQK